MVNNKSWYSGTPAPDRFDQGKDNQRGQVLIVNTRRGEKPDVQVMPTGRIKWHSMNFNFRLD